MQIRTGEEIGVVLLLCPACSFVSVLCLDRQILFEKEHRLLARCFGKLQVKVLQRSHALDFESWPPNTPRGSLKHTETGR